MRHLTEIGLGEGGVREMIAECPPKPLFLV